LVDRACLVTGATSDIDKATAAALASVGARMGLVARDAAKGEITLAEIRASSHNGRLDLFEADLFITTRRGERRRGTGRVPRAHDGPERPPRG
jgi:short-subunit dehydrogenase